MILKYLSYKLRIVGEFLYEMGYVVLVIITCPIWIPYHIIKKDYEDYKSVIEYQEKNQ